MLGGGSALVCSVRSCCETPGEGDLRRVSGGLWECAGGAGHLFICINEGYFRRRSCDVFGLGFAFLVDLWQRDRVPLRREKGKHAGMRVGYWIRYTVFSSGLCSFIKGLSSCLF